mgnify:CR=1 FL=1
MRTLSIFSVISLIFILSGCGGSEPTFDGSSKETADASLAAMFPEDFSNSADGPGDEDIPPALETYFCAAMEMAFSDLFNENQSQEEMDKALLSKFDGMTAADMEAYGVENDLIGCLSGLEEGLKEFGEALGDL